LQHRQQQQEQQQERWQVCLSASGTSTSSSSSSSTGSWQALLQLQQIFSAAAQLAAGRMVHLCLTWWAMALTSQSRWYGDNIHPVFLLVGNADLQGKLTARGVEGVPAAAAAAGRLLEVAAANSSSSSSSSSGGGLLPAVEDLLAVRRFVASLEGVMWCVNSTAAAIGGTSSSSNGSGRSRVTHWLEANPTGAAVAGGGGDGGGDQEGFSELLSLRPWWVTLSERFSHKLSDIGSSSPTAAAGDATGYQGSSLTAALHQHQHANVTAAAAYDQAVMAERNKELVTAMWQHAAAAAADEAEVAAYAQQHGRWSPPQQQQQQHAAVVAVVGYNHLPGIVKLWQQLQQQHTQQYAADSSSSSSSAVYERAYSPAAAAAAAAGGGGHGAAAMQEGAFLPWQVAFTDVVAGVLELAAAGGAGLCYWAGVNRWTAAAAAASSSSSSSSIARLAAKPKNVPGVRRLALLLLPAAVALLPLQRDAKRLQEAGGLLSKVAVVNDVILSREAAALTEGSRQHQSTGWQGAGSRIMQLALKAKEATAASSGAVA
jgi:hypothetical protein